ncbi:hypothetical protein C8J57DRAFT_1385621 [Mycena rebaudengoi]|nr:hypothetical protein C8J57DRAFT_1385621 [Mycena rebaudengoi]
MLAIFAFVLTALIFSANVAAQDLTEQQQCILKCKTDNVPQSGCGIEDDACLCASAPTLAAVTTCVVAGCGITAEDANRLIAGGCLDTGGEESSSAPGGVSNTDSAPGSQTSSGSQSSQGSNTPAGSNTSTGPSTPSKPTVSAPPQNTQSATAEMNAVRGGGAAVAALGLVFALL